MVAVVYNSKVAIIGGAESIVIVTKKFPGMFQVFSYRSLLLGTVVTWRGSCSPLFL